MTTNIRLFAFFITTVLATRLDAQMQGSFTPAGSLTTDRQGHTATLLTNGKVLIAGGSATLAGLPVWASAELFDPAGTSFTPTGSMGTPRVGHTATLLPDGRVLIAGGECPDMSPLMATTRFLYRVPSFTIRPLAPLPLPEA